MHFNVVHAHLYKNIEMNYNILLIAVQSIKCPLWTEMLRFRANCKHCLINQTNYYTISNYQ